VILSESEKRDDDQKISDNVYKAGRLSKLQSILDKIKTKPDELENKNSNGPKDSYHCKLDSSPF